MTITFACDPARTESLVKTAFQLIEQFRSTGPSDGQVADERSALTRDFETNSQRNGYLLDRLLFKYEHHEDVDDVFNMRHVLRSADRADDSRRGADVSRSSPLRRGDAVARGEVALEKEGRPEARRSGHGSVAEAHQPTVAVAAPTRVAATAENPAT